MLTPERAWQYALRLLAGRDYTVSKLREKLRLKDFSPEAVDSAVTKLIAEGWLNDRRFAERFAESALSSKCFYGPRLRFEMAKRGFSGDLIDDVVGQLRTDHDGNDGIRLLLERRYPGFCFASADEREKRRVIGFLQRKGYSYSMILEIIRKTV